MQAQPHVELCHVLPSHGVPARLPGAYAIVGIRSRLSTLATMTEKTRQGYVQLPEPPRLFNRAFVASFLVFCAALLPAFWTGILRLDTPYRSRATGPSCKVPLPNLLAYDPPTGQEALLQEASLLLDGYFAHRATYPDIDSLAVAVVTPSGTVFECAYGILRANESEPDKYGAVDSDSIYRIASITKMFTVLETLILRERGVLNWYVSLTSLLDAHIDILRDDPVTKFLPNFTYSGASWPEHLAGVASTQSQENITLRQLASHLSGQSLSLLLPLFNKFIRPRARLPRPERT